MFEDIDQETLDRLGDVSLEAGQASLPFPAPLLYVVNGNGNPKLSPAQQFGGWMTDKVKFDEIVVKEKLELPSSLMEDVFSTRKGGIQSVYSCRALSVAPVRIRSSWLQLDPLRRSPKYFEGARRHVQMLAILATRNNGSIRPWGPVVLTAKGYQAKRLQNAPEEWSRHTSEIRNSKANGLPAFLFYMGIGTFGAEIKQEQVGKGSQTSAITPLDVAMPEVSVALLEKLYGGDTLAKMIVDYNKQSAAWAIAWSSESMGEAGFVDNQPSDTSYVTAGHEYDDDIPF